MILLSEIIRILYNNVHKQPYKKKVTFKINNLNQVFQKYYLYVEINCSQ